MPRTGSSTAPWSQRAVIDYALQRRAALADLRRGHAFVSDLCDADPYLVRAAENHGVVADRPCPVCRGHDLAELNYVFGDELGPSRAESGLRVSSR